MLAYMDVTQKCKSKPLFVDITEILLICNVIFFKNRAYADAGPSVQHTEQHGKEEADFVKDTVSEAESENAMEASSGDEDLVEEGGEERKKKQRSGFRDRKVINKQ